MKIIDFLLHFFVAVSVSRTLCCVSCKLIKVANFPAALTFVKKSAKQNQKSLCEFTDRGYNYHKPYTTIKDSAPNRFFLVLAKVVHAFAFVC